MTTKCPNCGDNHASDNCTASTTKCANCAGEHQSTNEQCPKRQAFIEMRTKMSSKNNKKKQTVKQSLNVDSSNFPELSKGKNKPSQTELPEFQANNPWSLKKNPLFKNGTSSSINDTTPITPTNSNHPWTWVHENPNVHPSWKFNCGNLFSALECSKIFKELTSSLRNCMNKTEQLEVMFEVAVKYIYNGNP